MRRGREAKNPGFRLLAGIGLLLWMGAGCVTPTEEQPPSPGPATRGLSARHAARIEGIAPLRVTPGYEEYAPLSVVMRYWGKAVTPLEVKDAFLLYFDTRWTIGEQIEHYGRQWNLWAHVGAADLDRLRARVRAGVPTIVLLKRWPFAEARQSTAVVIGYDDEQGTITLMDGHPGIRDAPYALFESVWGRSDRQALIVCPPMHPYEPMDDDERFSRARFYEQTGRWTEAIEAYRDLIERGRKDSPLLTGLGFAYAGRGDYADAERVYREALAIDERNERACNNLAYLLAEHKQREPGALDEALGLARQALALNPESPMVTDTLGYVHQRRGEYREAADYLEHARALALRYPAALRTAIGLRLARVHQATGQWHLLREVLGDLMLDDPAFEAPDDLKPYLPQRP